MKSLGSWEKLLIYVLYWFVQDQWRFYGGDWAHEYKLPYADVTP